MLTGDKDYLKLGDFNAVCDVCGFKFKASELRRRWDGYMVCSSDYEQRHPQDLIRTRPDKQATPWARPPTIDSFVTPNKFDPIAELGRSHTFNLNEIVTIYLSGVAKCTAQCTTATFYNPVTVLQSLAFTLFVQNHGVGSTLPFTYLGAV